MRNRDELPRGIFVLLVLSMTFLLAIASFMSKKGETTNRVFAAELTTEQGEPGLRAGGGPAESCPSGMIAYWRFDETSGDTFADSIQGNDATCAAEPAACPMTTDGIVNGAVDFHGSDYKLTAPDDAAFAWSNDDSFSLELWVNTNVCPDDVFFGKYDTRASWWLGCEGGLPVFSLRDSVITDGIRVTGTVSIEDAQWHHIVGVRDAATNENRLYVDGDLADTDVVDYLGDFSNDNPITFGFHHDDYFVDALIDEVAAYNRVLSPGEIETHYERGLTGFGYCNLAAVVDDQTYETEVGVSVVITFDYSDPDGPGPYTVTIIDAPGHGALSGSGLQRTYTPDAGFKGVDSFTWRIHDGLNDSDVATTSIDVKANDENVPPVAASQSVTTTIELPVLIELEYSDPDGGSDYTVSVFDGPEHGTLTGTGVTRTYTPDATFVGEDGFSWIVNDGYDDSNVANVSIHVLDSTSYIYLPVIFKPGS